MLDSALHLCLHLVLPWLQVVTSTLDGGGRLAVTPGSSTCGGPHGKHMGGWVWQGVSHSTDPSPAPYHSTINYSKELPLAQGIKFE